MKYLTLLLLLLISYSCLAQEKETHDHITSSMERFERMRILPPAKVTYYDGSKVEFSISTNNLVLIKSFEVSSDTIISNVFKKFWKEKLWWVIYCVDDNHLYTISEVDKNQLK